VSEPIYDPTWCNECGCQFSLGNCQACLDAFGQDNMDSEGALLNDPEWCDDCGTPRKQGHCPECLLWGEDEAWMGMP